MNRLRESILKLFRLQDWRIENALKWEMYRAFLLIESLADSIDEQRPLREAPASLQKHER
ncbi:hypothetical protein [Vibrio furnissii]|uniref:hypothetical protein n=1 Tax=Vibrio furnissii TaxID=29494 RepID=UPI001EEB10C5|nr:hypothetical protein [Vibrio furnissii]